MLSGTFAVTNIQKVNAQMGSGNLTGGGMMGMMGGGPNSTGSIKLSTVMGNALSSQIKVGLNQSAITAEKPVGNNSHPVGHTLESKMDIWYTLYGLLMAVIPFIR